MKKIVNFSDYAAHKDRSPRYKITQKKVGTGKHKNCLKFYLVDTKTGQKLPILMPKTRKAVHFEAGDIVTIQKTKDIKKGGDLSIDLDDGDGKFLLVEYIEGCTHTLGDFKAKKEMLDNKISSNNSLTPKK